MPSSSPHRASVSSFRPLARHQPSLSSNMALICSLRSVAQAALPLTSPRCWFRQMPSLNSSLHSQSSRRSRLRLSPNWLRSRSRHSLKLNLPPSHSPSKSSSLCSSCRSPQARKVSKWASVPAGFHPSRASSVFESSYLPLLERGRAFR